MTHAISTFIALARQASKGSVEWGGYHWKITRTGLTTSLERVEIGTLSHIRIVETLSSQADEGPSYHATVRASDIARLVAYNGNLSSAQAGCSWTEAFQWVTRKVGGERWPHSFGQVSEIFKWNVRGNHAADLIAGSVAKYASSGV